MKEVTEILRLLAKAIEQNTVNTYQEQGSAAADVVFRILEDAEKRIDDLDNPTEKCGSCEWAMPIKGTINGVYVSYIECQNPEKVWNHNSSRRKKRTTPKCRFWQPKKKGGVQEC